MAAPSFPLERPLYSPADSRGPVKDGSDIVAVKIAISRAGFWPWQEFDDAYSNLFAMGVKGKGKRFSGVAGFKRAHDLVVSEGAYGKGTHEALLKTRVPAGSPHAGEWAFDARARYLYQGYEEVGEDEKVVAEIFKAWDILVAHEASCHYSQTRPIGPLARRQDPPVFPNWLDCSGTVLYTCWLADAKSPDPAYGYSGYGNTNSLNEGGFRISIDQVPKFCKDHLVLAFYGSSIYNTSHVTAVKSPTQVYSMGNEGAPEIIGRINYGPNLVEIRAYEVV